MDWEAGIVSRVLKYFGKRIRQLRKDRELTQEDLAERAGLHPTFIGAVERGTKNPSLESIAKISKALKIGLRDLFPPQKLSSEADQAMAEILDVIQGKSLKQLKLAKTVLQDVFNWNKQKKHW